MAPTTTSAVTKIENATLAEASRLDVEFDSLFSDNVIVPSRVFFSVEDDQAFADWHARHGYAEMIMSSGI